MLILIQKIFFGCVFLFFAEAATPRVKTEQLALLKAVNDKYIQAESILMNVSKTDKITALEQTRVFDGDIVLQKGKFRLTLTSKDKNKDESLVVADGTTIWFVTPPPKEFKNAKTQVLKAPMTNERARAQGFLQILTVGGVLKYFTVTGAIEDSKSVTYFLQPDKKSTEFRRAQLIINKDSKTLSLLRHWDAMDNETEYIFNTVEFNKKIDKKLLSYTPPKNADVVNYK